MEIIMRTACDNYTALSIVEGMNNAGAYVFSITYDGKNYCI
jgi:hypothetical protein